MNDKHLQACTSKLEKALAIVERRAFWAVGFWTIFYFVLAFYLAREKPFWNDELFTFYISRLPGLSDVWRALLTGAEQLPPFFFVITRASTAFLGSGHIAFRLPEMLGFWLMSVSVFQFVRVRLSVTYGLIAMTFPLVTAAFDYAYEARPYGLVLGFCALALCCWQASARCGRRALPLLGLALSAAAAMSCHYYAFLGLSAILLGESVRSFNRKKLDLSVWIAFGAGFIPLIFFLPLIEAARSYSGAFWAKPKWTNTLGFYNTLLMPTGVTLFMLLIALGVHAMTHSPQVSHRADIRSKIPAYEIAAVFWLSLIPTAGVVLAEGFTGAFNFRYALPAVIGLSILVSWSASAIARHRTDIGSFLLVILLALSLANEARSYLVVKGDLNARASAYQFLSTEAAGPPLVVVDPHLFFELSHDAAQRKPALNFIYLADVSLALKYTNTDTVDRGLLALKQWAPLDVQNFDRFCVSHDTFLVYGYPGPFEWVAEDLIAGGWKLIVKGRNGSELLYLVKRQRD
ncbi:MAG TPA: glycosyltransferase family 39 protein [Bryobacteraceae bacterium]|nr:glycosyltransferase family 39 protein [Bryobacteraceae bacterium]